ncbi:MAG: FtsW/RodA/SpoVE family cell cycle protein [Muribaculaceae bacterium]|nr:FtsW/RodA/SpoVE family cell cycle protein [Muribaculaceae bacterium]
MKHHQIKSKSVAVGMAFVSAMLIFGAFVLNRNYAPYFERVNENYRSHDACNLDNKLTTGELAVVLNSGGYVSDTTDARYIASWIVSKLQTGSFANLGTLNLNACRLEAVDIMQRGGEESKQRVRDSRAKLGEPDTTHLTVAPSAGGPVLQVLVRDKEKKPVAGVPVRLTEHEALKRGEFDTYDGEYVSRDTVLAWVQTDAQGVATFGVEKGHYYSVLPVRDGYEYGREQGTTGGAINDDNTSFTFVQRDHKLTPLSSTAYSRIKEDRALTVRTPSQWKDSLVMSVIIFLMAWWLGYLFIVTIDRRLGRDGDHLLLVALMALTAIGLLAMFSIADPLVDRLLGVETAWGVVYGVVALCGLSSVNYVKFYNSQSRVQLGKLKFDPIGSVLHLPKGMGYLLPALVLVVLLYLFGTGPEGSGARVNLGPFQPSEISKYLVVVFIAAFFTEYSSRIRNYAEHIDSHNAWFQLRTVFKAVVGIVLLLVLYLLLISDMGPALVLIVTFILLYSVARGDFAQLLLGVVTLVATLVVASYINPTPLTMSLFALLWLIAWCAGWWVARHRVYESAVMMGLLMVVFMLAGSWLSALGLSEGERLANRTAMAWSGVWNNDVRGGDQVAQGLWSLATGGLGGQGLGKGNPSLVPAFNTDMVLSSIGEVMGFVTLALILICLFIVLHRTLLVGRRAGHPFLFYLASGIAIVTGVQFFVIVLGSLGIIPLTGVAVPLLSYGKSSLIMNLAAFGVVISCSRHRATSNQVDDVKRYDGVVAASSFSFCALSVVVLLVLFWYMDINLDDVLIRPAYIANTQGQRMAEYNPRIRLLVNRLEAGNIYDRNGLLLATSSTDELEKNLSSLSQHGLNTRELRAMMHKRQRRYYPFAEHTFFMVGDYNTRILWSDNERDPSGYLAELRHLSQLRGFDNVARDDSGRAVIDVVEAGAYRYNRFLPAVRHSYLFERRDYSTLLPMLKKGLNSDAVAEHNAKRSRRDLTLTLDAYLQLKLQQKMAEFIQNDGKLRNNKLVRASVVVLDARNGDLLTSSCYPLPDQELIIQNGGRYYNDRASGFTAFTDRDLGLTWQTQPGSTAKVMSALAGYMKLGNAASRQTYMVYGDEAVDYNHTTGAVIDPTGRVSMDTAIVLSSNNYFVHLVNDKDLYHELDSIYRMVGIRVHNYDSLVVRPSYTPYFFKFDRNYSYGGEMEVMRNVGINHYTKYMTQNRARKHERFNWWQTGNAWGQHNIQATPLNMARVAAIVACDGKFAPTRYVLSVGTGDDMKPVEQPERIELLDNTTDLRHYMQKESDKHRRNGKPLPGSPTEASRMGGKTGTPERELGRRNINDAWYICFVHSGKQQSPLAIAVRLERTKDATSGKAVDFVARVVIPTLNEVGYQLQ